MPSQVPGQQPCSRWHCEKVVQAPDSSDVPFHLEKGRVWVKEEETEEKLINQQEGMVGGKGER